MKRLAKQFALYKGNLGFKEGSRMYAKILEHSRKTELTFHHSKIKVLQHSLTVFCKHN